MVLRRFLARHSLSRRRKGFHSRFGGLWTDRLDADRELERRVARHSLTADEANLLEGWIQNGYAILPGGVPAAACEALLARARGAWETGDPQLVVEVDREEGPSRHPLAPEHRSERTKVLDLHAAWPEARAVAHAPVVGAFLRLVFDDAPVAFNRSWEAFNQNPDVTPVAADSSTVIEVK